MQKLIVVLLLLISLSHVYAQKCSNGECSNSENDPDGFEYINKYWTEIRQYVIGYGVKLEAANEKLSDLDEILANRSKKITNHVSFCLADPDFLQQDIDSFTPWDRYQNLYTTIMSIPSTTFDMGRMKAPFLSIASDKRVDDVAIEFWAFSRRLQCLQILRPDMEDEVIENATALFETYLYMSKWIESDNKKKVAAVDIFNRRWYLRLALAILFYCITIFYPPVRDIFDELDEELEEFHELLREIIHPDILLFLEVSFRLGLLYLLFDCFWPGAPRRYLQAMYKIFNIFRFFF